MNKAYLGDVDNAKNASDALVENVKAGLSDVLTTRERLVDELARSVARSEQIAANAQQRILGLEDTKADQDFEDRTKNLSDAQKAIALSRRAQEIADNASKQLTKSGLLGDTDGIARALEQFDKAESLLSESGEIGKRIGKAKELRREEVKRRATNLSKNIVIFPHCKCFTTPIVIHQQNLAKNHRKNDCINNIRLIP